MADTAAPPIIAIGTTNTTVWTNPAGSSQNAVVRFTFNNLTTADVTLPLCNFLDASPAIAATLLPPNVKIPAGESISFDHVLEPGDAVNARANAAGQVNAVVAVFWEPK